VDKASDTSQHNTWHRESKAAEGEEEVAVTMETFDHKSAEKVGGWVADSNAIIEC
jgi:hypothetical protein